MVKINVIVTSRRCWRAQEIAFPNNKLVQAFMGVGKVRRPARRPAGQPGPDPAQESE